MDVARLLQGGLGDDGWVTLSSGSVHQPEVIGLVELRLWRLLLWEYQLCVPYHGEEDRVREELGEVVALEDLLLPSL